MRHSVLALLTLVGLLQAGVQKSQDVQALTFGEILAQIRTRNQAILATRYAADASAGRIPQAGAWMPPMFRISLMETPATSANVFRDAAVQEYAFEQTIPFPGKRSAASASAAAAARFDSMNARAFEWTVITSAKRELAMLYTAQRRIDVNSSNQDLVQQMIGSVRARLSAGLSSQADLLRLEIELSRLKNERAALEAEAQVPQAKINALRNVPPETPIGRLPDVTIPPFEFSRSDLADLAEQQRFEISAMRAALLKEQFAEKAASREYWPDLALGGAYRVFDAMPSTWTLMLGISVPLAPWSRGSVSGRLQEQQALVRQTEHALNDMIAQVRFEVFEAWELAKSHWEQLERYRNRILPDAEQAFASVRTAYQTGMADFLSLLDSFRTVQMYRMEYYTVVAQYLAYRAELECAVCTSLDDLWN